MPVEERKVVTAGRGASSGQGLSPLVCPCRLGSRVGRWVMRLLLLWIPRLAADNNGEFEKKRSRERCSPLWLSRLLPPFFFFLYFVWFPPSIHCHVVQYSTVSCARFPRFVSSAAECFCSGWWLWLRQGQRFSTGGPETWQGRWVDDGCEVRDAGKGNGAQKQKDRQTDRKQDVKKRRAVYT